LLERCITTATNNLAAECREIARAEPASHFGLVINLTVLRIASHHYTLGKAHSSCGRGSRSGIALCACTTVITLQAERF